MTRGRAFLVSLLLTCSTAQNISATTLGLVEQRLAQGATHRYSLSPNFRAKTLSNTFQPKLGTRNTHPSPPRLHSIQLLRILPRTQQRRKPPTTINSRKLT